MTEHKSSLTPYIIGHLGGVEVCAFKEAHAIEQERDALKARVAELEAAMPKWVEGNPTKPGWYMIVRTYPDFGTTAISWDEFDNGMWTFSETQNLAHLANVPEYKPEPPK